MNQIKFIQRIWLVTGILVLSACNSIQTGESIKPADIAYIQSLGLLEKDEHIIQFYSEYKNRVAGNFYTEKRVASYWIDEKDSTKNNISFALYPEIKSIDTLYDAGATYSPYMLLHRNDNTLFKVYVDGTRAGIRSFFEAVIKRWKQLPDKK